MAASLRGGRRRLDHGLATAGLLEHDLLVEALVVEDGRMRLPDGAGRAASGSRVDEAASRGTGGDGVEPDG